MHSPYHFIYNHLVTKDLWSSYWLWRPFIHTLHVKGGLARSGSNTQITNHINRDLEGGGRGGLVECLLNPAVLILNATYTFLLHAYG